MASSLKKLLKVISEKDNTLTKTLSASVKKKKQKKRAYPRKKQQHLKLNWLQVFW